MNQELKKEIHSYFSLTQTTFFATYDGKYPRARPVSMIFSNGNFYIATGTEDNKVKQIKGNDTFEFSYLFTVEKNSGYIRGAGIAEIVIDKNVREEIFVKVPFLKEFWKTSGDEGYTLLKLNVSEIEYMKPGEFVAKKYSYK